MAKYLVCFIGLMLALSLPALAKSPITPSSTKELVRTPDGNVYIWHRTPALEADLGMPILQEGVVTESMVYRVRDRKLRDLLFFVRVQITSSQSAEETKRLYTATLGADAKQETDATTGEITLTAGTPQHFRLVVITPHEEGCVLRLEHVQEFSVPPRVYTESEQRAIRIVEDVTKRYLAAQHINYTMEQRVVLPEVVAPEDQPPVLTWTVFWTRPAHIRILASIEKYTGLTISTEKENLRIKRSGDEDTLRPIGERLTIEDVREVASDPVACIMLGSPLITPLVDYLDVQAMDGFPAHQRVNVVLTYPDSGERLVIGIDVQKKQILSCETITTEEGRSVRTLRTYTDMMLEVPGEYQPEAITPQPQPQPAAAVIAP